MRARIRRPGRRTVLLAAALAALLIWGAAALGGDFFRSVSAALLQLRFDGHSPYDQEALTLTAPDGTAYRACAFLYTQAEEGTVYRDAVYDVTPEALTDCVLSGRFATGGQLLQGDWQVTFRLDS